MKVYVVEHRQPGFSGVVAGVDFVDGRGSTSSPEDVIRLVRAGCRLPDPAQRAEVRALAAGAGRRLQKRLEEYEKQAAFERTPAYTEGALKRMGEREAAAARSRPRRRRAI